MSEQMTMQRAPQWRPHQFTVRTSMCVCVCGMKCWRWSRKLQSCRWHSQSSVPSQQLGCFPRSSTHNPPPRMERDLLSCKHIGSSIENGLTKSIKADIIPGIRGWWWRGGGWGGLLRLSSGILPSFSRFLLALPSLNLCLLSLSVICVLSSVSPAPLGFSLCLFSYHHFSLLSLLLLPLSAFFFFSFSFHALGSGQPEKWLYQTYLQGCLWGGSFIWALEKEAPGPETAVQTWEWEDHEKSREESKKIQWSSGNQTSPCTFLLFFLLLSFSLHFFSSFLCLSAAPSSILFLSDTISILTLVCYIFSQSLFALSQLFALTAETSQVWMNISFCHRLHTLPFTTKSPNCVETNWDTGRNLGHQWRSEMDWKKEGQEHSSAVRNVIEEI